MYLPIGVTAPLILYLLPQITSAILIVSTNAYVATCIALLFSQKKLQNNLKLSGRDENKITKLQKLIHDLQMQLESSLAVFVLGGIALLLMVLLLI